VPVDSWIPPVNLLVEGAVFVKGGKQKLLGRLSNYNQAARRDRWLAVVDLDRDADCAPEFIQNVLPNPSAYMQLRVAVHAIEAWLIADRERISSYLGIPKNRVPSNPDAELDPKTTLVNLARGSNPAIRRDMVPREGSGGRVGRAYPSRLAQFVHNSWRPEVAALHSDSLRRCIEALQTWQVD
jgi:hypothetical protein